MPGGAAARTKFPPASTRMLMARRDRGDAADDAADDDAGAVPLLAMREVTPVAELVAATPSLLGSRIAMSPRVDMRGLGVTLAGEVDEGGDVTSLDDGETAPRPP